MNNTTHNNETTQHNQTRNNLTTDCQYGQYSVFDRRGPLVEEYLATLNNVLNRALQDHPRTFAFRVDLRLPSYDLDYEEDRLIERFIASLKKKIRHNREMAKKKNGRAAVTRVRYVWARETADAGKPHFHFAFFLNQDAFHKLGVYGVGHKNMYNRVIEAWASALDLEARDADGLVHIPKNAMYSISMNNPASINNFFYRASYLTKLETKNYGEGRHAFGASRI